jgi:hypothetical protein
MLGFWWHTYGERNKLLDYHLPWRDAGMLLGGRYLH